MKGLSPTVPLQVKVRESVIKSEAVVIISSKDASQGLKVLSCCSGTYYNADLVVTWWWVCPNMV